MAELFKYSLDDVVPFGPEVYERLFVLLNQDVWPVQLAWLAAGAVLLWLIVRGHRFAPRTCLAALGVAWLCVAYVFFLGRYQMLNWTGTYAAPVVVAYGIVLVVVAALGRLHLVDRRMHPAAWFSGIALLATGLVFYPLLALATHGSFAGAQVFGLAPDPTAAASLGIGVLLQSRVRWLVISVPVVWCIITALTLWVLGRADFALPLALSAVAVIAASVSRSASPIEGAETN